MDQRLQSLAHVSCDSRSTNTRHRRNPTRGRKEHKSFATVTEKEITAIVAEAIRSFNALSPAQRREARRRQRTRFVGDESYVRRPIQKGYAEEAETKYDNLN
jgi:hypothetical protein